MEITTVHKQLQAAPQQRVVFPRHFLTWYECFQRLHAGAPDLFSQALTGRGDLVQTEALDRTSQ